MVLDLDYEVFTRNLTILLQPLQKEISSSTSSKYIMLRH